MSFLVTKIIALLCFLFSFTSITFANTYNSIEYNLDLSSIDNSILKVEMILDGKFKDKIILNLPHKWASAMYTDQIKNFRCESKYKTKIIKNNKDSQVIITIPKHYTKSYSDKVIITYEVHQKSGNPSHVHEAIIRDNLVHAPGYGILSIPEELDDDSKIRFIVNWININPKWKTISSYGISNRISKTLTYSELLHAIYVAGDLRIYKIIDNPSPVFLSLHGSFDIKDRDIVSDLSSIINSQRKFFNDFDFPYYAISIIEGDDPRSMGGTALLNVFTAFLPKGMERDGYYILFAHENLHNWIGGKIRNNEDEEINYWWSEGFTDFYSRLISLRAGGIDKKTFVEEMNHFLQKYYLSPVNQEPNLRIKKDFWNNYDIEKLPYYRGFVFAIYLNNLIKKENPNKSLDDIMNDLLIASHSEKFSPLLFKNIAIKYIKNGVDEEILNFIDKGEIIPLENVELPMEKILMGKYDIGFNRELSMKNGAIQAIDTKSNAYKA